MQQQHSCYYADKCEWVWRAYSFFQKLISNSWRMLELLHAKATCRKSHISVRMPFLMKINKFYRNTIEPSPVVWRKNWRQKTSNVAFFRVTRWRFLKRWVSQRFSILSKWCLTLRESMKIERFFFFMEIQLYQRPLWMEV